MYIKLNTAQALAIASDHLRELHGHVFDILTIERPRTTATAVHLKKTVSKLTPIIGNLIEFVTVDHLNTLDSFSEIGHWERLDPGFPDAVLPGIDPIPGIEIKAWYPLATEISARFRESQTFLAENNTFVCILAWLPDCIIYGKPQILETVVIPALSLATARDSHYHNPPDYLVIEPEDTRSRTSNLQQTNTNGYKLQTASASDFADAKRIVDSWGVDSMVYSTSPEYQRGLRGLLGSFLYRLDTNFAKLDRIAHGKLEQFKSRVLTMHVHGMPASEWIRLLRSKNEAEAMTVLEKHLGIKLEDVS